MLRRFLGAVLIVIGLAAATIGGIGVSAFGTSGSLQTNSPPLQSSPKSYAIVVDILAIDAGFPGSSELGELTIGAEALDGDLLFIGYGQRSDVNAYLAQTQFDVVTQRGNGWDTRTVPGNQVPGSPEGQDFWLDSSTGVDPDVVFDVAGSDQLTVVVMNQGQSSGVDANLYVGYESEVIFPASAGAIAVGVVLVVGGVVLVARRGRKSNPPQTEPPSQLETAEAGRSESSPPVPSSNDREGR